MLEVLLFSFSVSIDAIGFSINFGSRNFFLSKRLFFLLNVLNCAVLTFFLLLFKFIPFVGSKWLGVLGSIIMICLGLWYIIEGIIKHLVSLHSSGTRPVLPHFVKKAFSLKEFFVLVFFFIVENVVSTIIFYSSLNYPVLFICATFIFHYMAFTIGYNLGDKLTKYLPFDASFISGIIFFILGVINFVE